MKDKDLENLIGCFLALLALPLLFIHQCVAFGVAFMLMWRWFIVPVFVTLPVVSLVQSIGIGLVTGLVTSKPRSLKKLEGEKPNHVMILAAILGPWITLFCSFIFKVVFC